MRPLVRIVICAVAAAVWPGAAGAAGAPNLTAAVKAPSQTSRVVRIVNRSTVVYRQFVVQSIRSPRIVAASGRCVVERDLGFNGTTGTWRYRAKCKKRLAAGQALEIRLTTQGQGRLVVFVVVNGALVQIDA